MKLATPILVILGNPPYNGFAGMTESEEERGLTDAYRTTTRAPAPQGQGLNDLYVRFFRMAERKIVEKTGQGVVCVISNYSWLDGLSHTGMRERYLEVFDRIWIDNLHGDRIISEYAPDGQTSETVFATQGSSVGIKIGTAISLLVRSGQQRAGLVGYRDWDQARAAERRASLVASGSQPGDYHLLNPAPELGLPFKPRAVGATYLSWPRLPDLFPVSFPGVKTSRDGFLVDIDRDRLMERLRQYFDANLTHEEVRRLYPEAMHRTARFDPEQTRDTLVRRGLLEDRVIPYLYRPFDIRWLYWEPQGDLLDRKREDYLPHVFQGNLWISAGQRNRMEDFYAPQVTSLLADHHIVESNVGMFPLGLAPERGAQLSMGELGGANITPQARAVLPEGATPEDLFFHALATLHAPAYAIENRGALRQDWPRVPIPKATSLLKRSVGLGSELARLLDASAPISDIGTQLAGRGAFAPLGALSSRDGAPLNPAQGDLAVTAGWGHAGRAGVTMPGRGRTVMRPDGALDIYLNDKAYWANVPVEVWEYTLGGYPVIKKWLSYRERELLGRDLTTEEARYVTEMVRRIAAILALGPALDENYEQVKADAYPWPRVGQ